MLIDLSWRDFEIMRDSEGSGIKMQVRPFEYEVFQKVLTFTNPKMEPLEGEDTKKYGMELANNSEFISFLRSVMPQYVRNLEGLQVKTVDGEIRNATMEDIVKETALFTLLISIFSEISSISTLQMQEVLNLKKK